LKNENQSLIDTDQNFNRDRDRDRICRILQAVPASEYYYTHFIQAGFDGNRDRQIRDRAYAAISPEVPRFGQIVRDQIRIYFGR
jgi:3'-phosphoadenosine 5'-phosphosulfate sulfotransferase (PAPS reductase)/FAD synthetase